MQLHNLAVWDPRTSSATSPPSPDQKKASPKILDSVIHNCLTHHVCMGECVWKKRVANQENEKMTSLSQKKRRPEKQVVPCPFSSGSPLDYTFHSTCSFWSSAPPATLRKNLIKFFVRVWHCALRLVQPSNRGKSVCFERWELFSKQPDYACVYWEERTRESSRDWWREGRIYICACFWIKRRICLYFHHLNVIIILYY